MSQLTFSLPITQTRNLLVFFLSYKIFLRVLVNEDLPYVLRFSTSASNKLSPTSLLSHVDVYKENGAASASVGIII